jgi:hypothetical protein
MAKRKSPSDEANGHVEGNGAAALPAPEPQPEQSDAPVPKAEAPRERDDRPNLPVYVARYGLIRATVWANQTEQGVRYNTVITRLYKGAGDAWFSTPSLGYRDLPLVEKAAAAAFQWISEQYATADVPF